MTNDYMPEFVLERIQEIMEENGIDDFQKIGLYGITYKENVDDCRESPTLQLIDKQKKHFATPLKTYDPYVNHIILENQFLDLEEFLENVDIVVVMVKHSQIVDNSSLLENKIVLDCHNVIRRAKKIYKL